MGSGIYTLHGVYGWEIRKRRIEVVDGRAFGGKEGDE
jgi:hypothetical protein